MIIFSGSSKRQNEKQPLTLEEKIAMYATVIHDSLDRLEKKNRQEGIKSIKIIINALVADLLR